MNPEADELSRKIIEDVIKLTQISTTVAAGTVYAADLLVRSVMLTQIKVTVEKEANHG